MSCIWLHSSCLVFEYTDLHGVWAPNYGTGLHESKLVTTRQQLGGGFKRAAQNAVENETDLDCRDRNKSALDLAKD